MYLVHAPEGLQSTLKISHFDKGPPELPYDGRFQSLVLKQSEDAQEVFEKVKGLHSQSRESNCTTIRCRRLVAVSFDDEGGSIFFSTFATLEMRVTTCTYRLRMAYTVQQERGTLLCC